MKSMEIEDRKYVEIEKNHEGDDKNFLFEHKHHKI